MKLQLQGQSVRLRVDEAELVRLLAGETVVNCIALGAAGKFQQCLVLDTGEDAGTLPAIEVRDGSWHVQLPRATVQAYAGQLPCRHALGFELELGPGEAVALNFEVDVRDSLKARGPRRRQEAAGRVG